MPDLLRFRRSFGAWLLPLAFAWGCQPGPLAVPDGGSDSGAADAGPADAGAALDAGVRADGGPWDGGAADAGLDGGAGVFVAVGYGGRRLRSTDDGQTWTDDQQLVDAGGDDTFLLRSVGFGGGQFVAVGWRIMTSPDGQRWTDVRVMSQWLGGLQFANGQWVAAGGYGRRSHSADGVTWQDAPSDGVTTAFRALTHSEADRRWIAVGDGALRMSTPDGVTWSRGAGDAGTAAGRVASGGSRVVEVDGPRVIVSTDGGAGWGAVATLPTDVSDVAYGDGLFVAVGRGHVHTSADAVQWGDHPVPGIDGVISCHVRTCVVVSATSAWRSTDSGGTWVPAGASTGSRQSLERVTWGNP